MKAICRRGRAFFLVAVSFIGGAEAVIAAPIAPLGETSQGGVEQIASRVIVPPSRLVCDGSRRVCVRWHNVPGGVACSRWELRFYGCRAR
jgi:hypothetical protein